MTQLETVPPSHAARWEAVHMPNYGTPRLLFTQGRGAHLTDAQGRVYTDLLAGIAVNILGHAHPAVVAAVQEQVARLGHVSNLYASEPALRLCERLHGMSGGRRTILTNSGAEANEAALKLVRRHAASVGRKAPVVVAFEGSFHGRTLGALALTGQPKYHEGFAPLPGGIVHVPYNDAGALEKAFGTHEVAAVFTEFVQGEGGVVPMKENTARTLACLAGAHGALIVADEVQTGIGRTGSLFAADHYGLQPDVITLAKALGGGLPIGAMLARRDLAPLLGLGSHGTTFGGNPVSAAAALAVLEVYEKERLAERAARLGREAQTTLADLLSSSGIVPRGLGLLLGLPIPKEAAPQVVQTAEERGVLVGQAGKGVVRLAPPLVIEDETLHEALPVVADAIRSVLRSG